MLIEPELRNGGGIERLTLRPERAGPRALRYSQSKPAAHFPRAGSYTLLRPGRARSGGGQNLTSEFGFNQEIKRRTLVVRIFPDEAICPIHLPGEPADVCKCLVSAFMCVHPPCSRPSRQVRD